MSEPTGNLDPFTQCIRCGYWVDKLGYVVHGTNGDIMRYGPDFAENRFISEDIDEDKLCGHPLLCCSINCMLDLLSQIYEKDKEQFTCHCLLLSVIYDVDIGLPIQKPRQYTLDRSKTCNSITSLIRWGGTLTYAEYRDGFTCPPFSIQMPDAADTSAGDDTSADDDSEKDETVERKVPEDEDVRSDPIQFYDITAETRLYELEDTEELSDDEFDHIPVHLS